MKIALFQMSPAQCPTGMLDRVEAAMHDAAENGADILVTPAFSPMYNNASSIEAHFSRDDWATRLTKSAISIGISLVAGVPEQDGDTHRTSALIINLTNPDSPAIFRKAYLYDDEHRTRFVGHGPYVVTADFDGIMTGFLMCDQIEFADNIRQLAQAGVDLIVVPTGLPQTPDRPFDAHHSVPIRAVENQIFMAYANHAQADGIPSPQGSSCIVAPDGGILCATPQTGDALIYATIDPAEYVSSGQQKAFASEIPFSKHLH